LRRLRDFAEVKNNGVVTQEYADKALNILHVDSKGFDLLNRRLLLTIIEQFNGGPVGLDTLSAAIGGPSDTIEDVLEPYLIQQGFIQRTPRGRMATPQAHEHFSLSARKMHKLLVF
jgi:Holliday junction DNA helicase RuvB